MKIAKCSGAASARSSDSPLAASYSPLPAPRSLLPRSAITLVELLITILIISILAGLILGVASVAGETAREAHTRNVVTRLHTLLMEHYGTYKTRRVRLAPTFENSVRQSTSLAPTRKGEVLAEARLYALREMILMEVPDRWSDVLLTAVGATKDVPPVDTEQQPLYLAARTDLSNIYLRRYKSLVGRINAVTNERNTTGDLWSNQGAECLYMIITLATGDGEARSLFGERDIGDSDGDGAPEFLDGWGRPINFLRWAPGFDSEIQINANEFDSPTLDDDLLALATQDHDPFDLFRVQPNAFRLIPLIYSPGRDEDSGLETEIGYVTWKLQGLGGDIQLQPARPHLAPRLDPYAKTRTSTPVYLGSDNGQGTSTDNIHNHLLGQR